MRRATFVAILSIGVVGLLLGTLCVGTPNVQGETGSNKPPDFQVIVPSKYDFDDTMTRLVGSIEDQNLMVITQIDAQQMLRLVGVKTKGMRQVLFFHPRYMKQLLQTNKHATIEPPLKIAVMEAPNGKVMLRYIKPSNQFGRYANLRAFGEELDRVMANIVAVVQH